MRHGQRVLKAIICDIDGTVADLSHRLHHLDKKDWDAFFAEADKDTPITPTLDVIDDILYRRYEQIVAPEVIFVSARPERLREVTTAWLKYNLLHFTDSNTLLMRKDGDTRADHIVKEEILDHILGQGYEIEAVFDDRPSVVDMWKRRGLHVFQVHAVGAAPVVNTGATLHLLVGPSHAGKTWWAREDETNAVHLSSDTIRYNLTGNDKDQSRNDEVFALLHSITKTYLTAGINVIYDATNLRRKDRIAAAHLNNGGPVVYHVFDRPLGTKLASLRHDFPADVVRKHDQMFRSQLSDILAGDNLTFVTVKDHR